MQRIVAFLNQFGFFQMSPFSGFIVSEASSMERFSRLNDALEHLEHQMVSILLYSALHSHVRTI